MTKFLKALAAVAAVALIASPVVASTGLPASTTPRQKIEYINLKTACPGVAYKVPALAQNAIDTCFVNIAPVMKPYIYGNLSPYLCPVTSYGSIVAGDSLNVSIDVGPTTEGPWLNVVSAANSWSHTASLAVRQNPLITSTLVMGPVWRVRLKSKGTATLVADKKFYIFFPTPMAGI